jgi:O-antigen biosynthesis protein WbqP
LLISPLLALICFIIFMEDGAPVLFSQERLGLNREVFRIYKLRTMNKETPQAGTHDVGINYYLKTGSLIRALKLDEFPQLFNIIVGDINLVGPRPGLPEQSELAEQRLKKNIFSIKPGITGLAQISGYDMSNPKKLAEIDEIYLQEKSFKLDATILIGTFFSYPRTYLKNKFNI